MPTNHAQLNQPVTERDHTLGPANAPVTLVEYGDFECPHCGAAFPVIEHLRKELGDRLRFVYRHFPLEMHEYAQIAAEAAEAADSQDAFWKMHDTLLRHQSELDVPHLLHYAGRLGLNEAQVQRELSAHLHRDRVQADMLSGSRSGVHGTPTFFINGVRYEGGMDGLRDALEQAAGQGQRNLRARG